MIWRYRFALFLLVIAFLFIVSKLFYWQIIKADELSVLGQSQYGQFVKYFPKRGEIKTSDSFPIVSNRLTYLIFANPKEVKDQKRTAELLSIEIGSDSASISALLSKNLFWVPVKSHVENEIKEKVEALHLSGVGFEQESVRFYPEASMAAQLLGFVGKNQLGEDKGYFGLEGYYDRQLIGKPGVAVQIHDALGRPILAKMNANSNEVDGRKLTLSVNRTIQFLLEEKLKAGIDKYQAVGGSAVAMDPKTGNILAMASFPSFDPLKYADYESGIYKNPVISNVYEPGSTFKALIMASALDAKIVKPETRCPICQGPVSIGGYEIKTWDNKYFNNTTMTEVIQHSDNTGMVFVAQSLGLDRLLSYLDKFGIGGLTGIDLQGEVEPAMRARNYWYPIDLATAGFGQGISVTPIELLDAFASIANEGQRMEPHVVSKIETPFGETINIPPKVLERPISPQTAKVMTEILVNAVNKGEAQWVKIPGYRIAGKTGTAQIPIAGHYDPNKTITSFIGFGPADDPKFVMLVILDRPTTSIYGSETAAPIFFSIAKDILNYYNIPPTE